MSQTNRLHIPTTMVFCALYHHTFPVSFAGRYIIWCAWYSVHCLFIHLLHLMLIRDKFQCSWIIFNGSFTHPLCLVLVGYIIQQPWFSAHCIITHFLCLKRIREKFQEPWVFFNSSFTHLLCLKMIRDKFQCPWIIFNGSFTHLLCLVLVGYIFHQPR